MNLLLPELDIIPTDPDVVPLLLAEEPPTPADLPGWMPTDRTPLEAVMVHDAVDIVAAILALGATSTDDVPALRDYLARPIAHQTLDIPLDVPELLTADEVAGLFGVDPRTVSRWVKAGKLEAIHTQGGHRRYRRAVVEAMLAASEVRAS